ncbi:MFS transporter [Gordonia insulae]|uniref:Putative MFS-type transporter EfpA n=1 Tax=Gordonia insulae TaxID=2420509 RepID=A0A3G8JQE5_9ACTN|nr:MFS transporter [Gordonia insulae]AZG46935.1 putative MFS-type transporter EfpA [Gordonia insulae]
MTGRSDRADRAPTLAVAVLAFVQFVIVVDETTVSLLGPAVARDLGLGDEARQLLVTPFAAGFVCALPVAGVVLRRIDPRRALIPATAVFATSAAAGALADSAALLAATRVAQGASGAVTATCVLGALHMLTRGALGRRRAFAVFSLVSGSGAVAALVLAGPLATESWRWCFVAVAVAALAGAIGWAVVQPPRVVGQTHHASGPDRVADDTGHPVDRRIPTIVSFLAVVGANAVLAATVISVSFALQQDHSWSPMMAGLAFLPLNAAAAVGTIVIARSRTRGVIGRTLSAGVIVLVIGCTATAAVPSVPGALILALLPVGLGVGLVFPLVNDGSLATAGARPLGRAAMLGAAQQTGLASGALVAAAHSDAALGALAVVLAITTAITVIGARRR